MGAKNEVIAGDYKGEPICVAGGESTICRGLFKKSIGLNSKTVESYELQDSSSQKSAASAVGRAAVGAFVLGPVGIAAGLSAKSKGTYTVVINFKDGKRSLVEVGEKEYKALMQKVF